MTRTTVMALIAVMFLAACTGPNGFIEDRSSEVDLPHRIPSK